MIDKFGRSAAQVKSDQREILTDAFVRYPEWVDAMSVKPDTPARRDIHELIDSGLLERHHSARNGVAGDDTFVPMYRLTRRGMDMLRKPHWLDQNYPRIVNVTAYGSAVNVNSPNASATSNNSVQLLLQLRAEIERANLAPEEKSGLLSALDKITRHPAVLAILAKLLLGG